MNEPSHASDSQFDAEHLLDELFEEVAAKVQAGEDVDIEEYAARAPEQADRLRRLLHATLSESHENSCFSHLHQDLCPACTGCGGFNRGHVIKQRAYTLLSTEKFMQVRAD